MSEKRPPYYAMKFLRLLLDVNASDEIGVAGVALLTAVVIVEDQKRYPREVRFFNSQLMSFCQTAKWETFDALRTKVIEAGWLEYRPATAGSRQADFYRTRLPSHFHDGIEGSTFTGNDLRKSASKEPSSFGPNDDVRQKDIVAGYRDGARGGDSAGGRRGVGAGVGIGEPPVDRAEVRSGQLSFPFPISPPPPPPTPPFSPREPLETAEDAAWRRVVEKFIDQVPEIREVALEARTRGDSAKVFDDELTWRMRIAESPVNRKLLTNPGEAVVQRLRNGRWPVEGVVDDQWDLLLEEEKILKTSPDARNKRS